MTAAEIFQAMRLADPGKVREQLQQMEKFAKRKPESHTAIFLPMLFTLFDEAKRKPEPYTNPANRDSGGC